MFGLRHLGKKVRSLFSKKIDAQCIEDLEELFFESDLGTELCLSLSEKVSQMLKKDPSIPTEAILSTIKNQLLSEFSFTSPKLEETTLKVHLIVGTNGNGKTTTCAKLASLLQKRGEKVLVIAADTFRAAAIEQLQHWSEKIGVDFMKGQFESDPAAICFDGMQKALNRGYDAVIIDTAGRLHNKSNLMEELKKIHRSILKAAPTIQIDTLLCLDATIGQNALDQALTFHQFIPLSGLVLTKTDGTAKGGAAIALQKKLSLPIRFLGTGEHINDLVEFDPVKFVNSLF